MAYRVRIVYIGPELLVGDSFVGWHYRDGNGTKKENPQLHPKPFVKIGGGVWDFCYGLMVRVVTLHSPLNVRKKEMDLRSSGQGSTDGIKHLKFPPYGMVHVAVSPLGRCFITSCLINHSPITRTRSEGLSPCVTTFLWSYGCMVGNFGPPAVFNYKSHIHFGIVMCGCQSCNASWGFQFLQQLERRKCPPLW